MSRKTTAARRLITVLEKALATGTSDTSAQEVWATVFEVDRNDGVAICRQLVVLADLLADIEQQVKGVQTTAHETYLEGLDQIRVGFSPFNLSQQRRTAIEQYITRERMARLQFCDLALMGVHGEDAISLDDLGLIDQAAKQLFDMVRESVTDTRLRTVLLEALERVRRSIAMYQIHGAKGLRESLQSLVGVAVLERDGLTATQANSPDLLDQYGKLVVRLDKATTVALKTQELIHKAAPLFEMLTRAVTSIGN